MMDLGHLMRTAIERQVASQVHVSFPAVVISYDPTLQRATVKPVIRPRIVDPQTREHVPDPVAPPAIPNLPVAWQVGAAGSSSITMPLQPGDAVRVVVSDRSVDEWLATGSPDVSPLDARRFSPQDGWVVPAGGPTPLPPTAVDPAALVVSAPMVKLGDATAADRALKGTLFEANLGAFLDGLIQFLTAASADAMSPGVAAAAMSFLPVAVAFRSQVASTAHQSTRVFVSS